MQIFGQHNMENLMATLLVAESLGISFVDSLTSMQEFKGSAKRLERIHNDPVNRLDVYRDFAHAPSKLRASIKALRALYAERQLVAIYELHTYSSLQTNFLEHYADTLADADVKAIYLDAEALAIKNRTGY